MGRNISHKVGIKVLSDTQLENVLPTYENLFDKIEICRKVAREEVKENRKRHYQYNFMYDNVFSILGQRGTGKTSVAFTLQEKIRTMHEEKDGDVVLPLIIPEIIPDNCSVLGWLLAIVKEEIEKLENEIKKIERMNRRQEFWERCELREDTTSGISLCAHLDTMNQLLYAGNYNPDDENIR